MNDLYLNKAQFKTELEKCLQCPSKPCMKACPVHCSPCDFIAAARNNDWQKAAALIYQQNPLGEVCGLICPDRFCMQACVRSKIDYAIKIPSVQAVIMKIAREKNLFDGNITAMPKNIKIAVIGAGPAGIGVTSELLKKGFAVTVFEKENTLGGALNLIPVERLPREIILYEWQKLQNNPLLKVEINTEIKNYENLLQQGYDAVAVATGEQRSRILGIEGEQFCVDYKEYLKNPAKYATNGHVVIIGGGAVATDCAITAAKQGAMHTEMFVRRRLSDMRITPFERETLLRYKIDITTMTRVSRISKTEKLTAYTIKTMFDSDGKLVDESSHASPRENIDLIVLALGGKRSEEPIENASIFYAGDFLTGGSTAVEAISSGKEIAHFIEEKFL